MSMNLFVSASGNSSWKEELGPGAVSLAVCLTRSGTLGHDQLACLRSLLLLDSRATSRRWLMYSTQVARPMRSRWTALLRSTA